MSEPIEHEPTRAALLAEVESLTEKSNALMDLMLREDADAMAMRSFYFDGDAMRKVLRGAADEISALKARAKAVNDYMCDAEVDGQPIHVGPIRRLLFGDVPDVERQSEIVECPVCYEPTVEKSAHGESMGREQDVSWYECTACDWQSDAE